MWFDLKITCKASDAAENLQLYRVVLFFRPRSSCTMHISANVQRITLNDVSYMTILGGRTEQLDIIAGFLPCDWLYEWFSQFHSCGTYSILLRSPSNALVSKFWAVIIIHCPGTVFSAAISCLHSTHVICAILILNQVYYFSSTLQARFHSKQ